MLSKQELSDIIAQIKYEFTPAIGCTKPIAVALEVIKVRNIRRIARYNRGLYESQYSQKGYKRQKTPYFSL